MPKLKLSQYEQDTFSFLARLNDRFRTAIIIFWAVFAIALYLFAPKLREIEVANRLLQLPPDAESMQAGALLDRDFASSTLQLNPSIIIVSHSPDGIFPQARQEIKGLCDWLQSKAAPPVINKVVSVFNDPAFKPALVSRNGTTMVVLAEISKGSSNLASQQAVEAIQDHIRRMHPHVQIFLTGSAPISADINASIRRTTRRTTHLTIALIVFLLLVIFRSPVTIWVPLATIAAAYVVSRAIAGYLVVSSSQTAGLADAYLVVMVFGIGTDYCLFLISRFREELMRRTPAEAIRFSLLSIGPVISASALTVIVTLLCLGISTFRLDREAGYTLAIGVGVTLIGALTLAPALIGLFGRKLFWPFSVRPPGPGAELGFWDRLGWKIVRRPVRFVVLIVFTLGLAYAAIPQLNFNAGALSQLPKNAGAVRGLDVLAKHFSGNAFAPIYVLIRSKGANMTKPDSLKAIAAVAQHLGRVKNVARVEYFSAPVAKLHELSRKSKAAGRQIGRGDIRYARIFGSVFRELQDIAARYPGILLSADYRKILTDLKRISDLSLPMLFGGGADAADFARISRLAGQIGDRLAALAAEFDLQGDTPLTAWIRATYFSRDGATAKITVILSSNPSSNASLHAVNIIRRAAAVAVEDSVLAGSVCCAGGEIAMQSDVVTMSNADFLHIIALAIFSILLVTGLLLRSLIAPLYMVATVLFNFGATMGISTWLFVDLLDQSSLVYSFPMYVFVILVAVGSDYNIFLVSRIREEAAGRPLKESVHRAVAHTGTVITACGIVLAGTFATLTLAYLKSLVQVGTGIAIGVLTDTFLIRSMLIPAIAVLFGRWNWWPSKSIRRVLPEKGEPAAGSRRRK